MVNTCEASTRHAHRRQRGGSLHARPLARTPPTTCNSRRGKNFQAPLCMYTFRRHEWTMTPPGCLDTYVRACKKLRTLNIDMISCMLYTCLGRDVDVWTDSR